MSRHSERGAPRSPAVGPANAPSGASGEIRTPKSGSGGGAGGGGERDATRATRLAPGTELLRPRCLRPRPRALWHSGRPVWRTSVACRAVAPGWRADIGRPENQHRRTRLPSDDTAGFCGAHSLAHRCKPAGDDKLCARVFSDVCRARLSKGSNTESETTIRPLSVLVALVSPEPRVRFGRRLLLLLLFLSAAFRAHNHRRAAVVFIL